ncbi:(2Fe-2S)-binding protein [Methylomonas fluvii]|uniref:Bacterioferritin-associated ferredoxin n=1 Tax=Methylomonas fluvii TaxID=1854564 RepID=A0ABR9DF74_9GAMM|nr:(2Fe-2S)-binding protein [Methylomonas fluvii]MBD9361723.1 (2Fe-2S)-binding protein [Methylomonas fluvii]
MYVCVCKAVTDRQVTQAISQGVCNRRQLMQCTGAGGVCGKCTASIKALLDENTQNRKMHAQAQVQAA